jgi:26S proteasome regulatory subunit N2
LLVSKIYYYLGVMEEAVNFALKGYSAFTQEPEGEYTETIVGESA